jgi:hypothetical protein
VRAWRGRSEKDAGQPVVAVPKVDFLDDHAGSD